MPANAVLSSLLASYGDSGAKKLPQFVLSIGSVTRVLPWRLLCLVLLLPSVMTNRRSAGRMLRLRIMTRDVNHVTLWGIRTWEWAADRVPAAVEGKCPVTTPLLSMPVHDFAYWLGKFVLEVRKKKDASEYPPKTLYRMVCCFKSLILRTE